MKQNNQIITAFRTFREDGRTRTTGLVAAASDKVQPSPKLAIALNKIYGPPFPGPSAASGKVTFIDIVEGRVTVFQVSNGAAEKVFCGNANVAAAVLAAQVTGQRHLPLSASDGETVVTLGCDIHLHGSFAVVESTWRVSTDSDHFDFEPGQAPVAKVSSLNAYEFSVGPRLTSAAKFASNRRKACRIIPGAIPEIQVSSCGRIHGALPQTGAISLQLARSAFPFIREALPGRTVRHPAGLEVLPDCYWQSHDFVAVMPRTFVELAPPTIL